MVARTNAVANRTRRSRTAELTAVPPVARSWSICITHETNVSTACLALAAASSSGRPRRSTAAHRAVAVAGRRCGAPARHTHTPGDAAVDAVAAHRASARWSNAARRGAGRARRGPGAQGTGRLERRSDRRGSDLGSCLVAHVIEISGGDASTDRCSRATGGLDVLGGGAAQVARSPRRGPGRPGSAAGDAGARGCALPVKPPCGSSPGRRPGAAAIALRGGPIFA